MSLEKIPVNQEKKYAFKGYFDVRDTYKFLISYLENSLNYWDVTEVDFEEKNLDGVRELISKVEAEKIYNDYFRIILKYEVKFSGNDVELNDGTRHVVMTKGTAKIALNSYIIPDWGGGRSQTAFRKFLGQIYDKFVGTDDMAKCMGTAAGDVGQVLARFKEHMNSSLK